MTRVALVNALLLTVGVQAQVQTGHYLPGFNGGLQTGIMATEAGFYMASITYFYNATEFKDGNGDTVPGTGETDYILTEVAFVGRPNWRLFGADYQAVVTLDFANMSSRPVVDSSGNWVKPPFGLSDIFFSPLTLGWHFGDFHLLGSLSGFAPTGSYELGSDDNTGTGFWTFMPYVAGTYRFNRGVFEKVPVSATAALRYEIHSKQDGHDFRPGDTLTFEYGVGAQILKRTSVGVLGFVYQQATDPRGSDVQPVDKYSSLGLGGTIGQGIGPVDVAFRYYRDFDVRNGPQGDNFYLEISWGF